MADRSADILEMDREIDVDSIDVLLRKKSLEVSGKPARNAEPAAAVEDLPGLEGVQPLPMPGDPYKAFARPANGALPSLSLVIGPEVYTYPYSGIIEGPHRLSLEDAGSSYAIVQRIAGISPIEIRYEGRNLEHMHSYLAYHRIAWVREFPAGKFPKEPDGPIVTRILIRRKVPGEKEL